MIPLIIENNVKFKKFLVLLELLVLGLEVGRFLLNEKACITSIRKGTQSQYVDVLKPYAFDFTDHFVHG